MLDRNTAELNRYEIEEEKLDRIQAIRDKRASELIKIYEEDPAYWVKHTSEDQAKEMLVRIYHLNNQISDPMDYRVAEIDDVYQQDMKHVAELQAIKEINW